MIEFLGDRMVFTPLHPPVPPHYEAPAYPPRALSRLALAQAYAEVADLATTGVPTVCDRYATAHDVVEVAARLVAVAHEVLDRAVVHARQLGGTCLEMADALALTEDQARERYAAVLNHWDDTLAQPWQHSGEVVVSRLPAGAREPHRTAHHLDRWCTEHLPPTSAARQTAHHDGVSDHMVSAHLPTQPVTPPPIGLSPTTTAQPGHADATAVVEGGRR
jgi:hypothetical protein